MAYVQRVLIRPDIGGYDLQVLQPFSGEQNQRLGLKAIVQAFLLPY